MSLTAFDSYTEARAHLKDLLDAADQGRAAMIRRDRAQTSLVDTKRLRRLLEVQSPEVKVWFEDGAWALVIPGMPIAVEATALDDAVDDMIDALREYAEAWDDHLRHAPNHVDNWVIVQLVASSDDDELREWITGIPR